MKARYYVFLTHLIKCFTAEVLTGVSVGELEHSRTNQIILVRIPEISVNQGQQQGEAALPAVTSQDLLQSQHDMSPITCVRVFTAKRAFYLGSSICSFLC